MVKPTSEHFSKNDNALRLFQKNLPASYKESRRKTLQYLVPETD